MKIVGFWIVGLLRLHYSIKCCYFLISLQLMSISSTISNIHSTIYNFRTKLMIF